jgi:uncharacterized protein YggT (Ycf19 family)
MLYVTKYPIYSSSITPRIEVQLHIIIPIIYRFFTSYTTRTLSPLSILNPPLLHNKFKIDTLIHHSPSSAHSHWCTGAIYKPVSPYLRPLHHHLPPPQIIADLRRRLAIIVFSVGTHMLIIGLPRIKMTKYQVVLSPPGLT